MRGITIDSDPLSFLGAETLNNSIATSPSNICFDSSLKIIFYSSQSNGASSKSSCDKVSSNEFSISFYGSVGKFVDDI